MTTLLEIFSHDHSKGNHTGSISFSVGTIKTSSRTRLAVCDRGFIEWPPCGKKLLPSVKIAFCLYNEFSSRFTTLVCASLKHHLRFIFGEKMNRWGMTSIVVLFIHGTHSQEFTNWFFPVLLSSLPYSEFTPTVFYKWTGNNVFFNVSALVHFPICFVL